MNVFDNFITKQYQDQIEETLCNNSFPWYREPLTVNTKTLPVVNFTGYNNVVDSSQFIHFLKNENTFSNFYYLITPIITQLEIKLKIPLFNKIVRAKANLLTQDRSNVGTYHFPHRDMYDTGGARIQTLLYYVNDSDGDTVLFNERDHIDNTLTERVRSTPRKGKAIFFDSEFLHTSTSPILSKERIVINILFKF